jgi:L-type amino acid transporter 9
MTLIFIIAGDIASLIDFASFLIWMFYGIAMVALLVMRRTKKDEERPYKVLQCCLFFCLLVCFVQTYEDPDLFFKPGKA